MTARVGVITFPGTLDEVDDSVTDDELEEIAGTLLANPVIETWTVTRLVDA